MVAREKNKILLANVEPQNVRNLFDVLDNRIYRVFVASNGKSAVEQACRYQPDAIIMDWDMPEMDGMEAIKIIRATDEIKNIPIIVATGKTTSVENLRTALETCANDYIRKPYDPIEIEARVKSMIRLSLEQQETIRLEKEIMQQKLEEPHREMEINIQALSVAKLHLINNSRNIETLVGALQELVAHTDETGEKLISDIVSTLKVSTASINWKEFEILFEKVHPSFFSSLRKFLPDLTGSEIELCAFLRLNMSNKEIMAITHKNDNTLKKSRQRLKKKLGLDNDESLYKFIRQFE